MTPTGPNQQGSPFLDPDDFEEAVADIKRHEGFRANVYKCTAGEDTILYGTKLPFSWEEISLLAGGRGVSVGEFCTDYQPMTEAEGDLMLRTRLNAMLSELADKLNVRGSDWKRWHPCARRALADMAYNMGVPGLLGFRRMLAALDDGNYVVAAREALDSKWAREDVGESRSRATAALIGKT